MRGLIATLIVGLFVALAPAASAQSYHANTTTAVYMRTGPDTHYPPVALVPAGSPVLVHGCVSGWVWCDVSWGPNRGWMAGAYLTATYQNRVVPYGYYGPRIGVPIIPFLFGRYWDRHYRGRSWYHNRGRYQRFYRSHRGRRRH
jgi:uncharacterized protein YraI